MTNFEEPKRFWSKIKVSDPDECWEWQASRCRKGYGHFWVHYRLWQAPRVAWTLTYGPIPKGLCVCHHCDNPGCCNPYHLFLGTYQDNVTDSVRKGRRAKGEQHGRAKLTKGEVQEIRQLYAGGGYTYRGLADEFGVSSSQISNIINRKFWAWLDEKETK